MQWFTIWEENPFIMHDSSLVISLLDDEEITLYHQPLPKNMNNITTLKVSTQTYNTITQPKKIPFFYTILETESICYIIHVFGKGLRI